ncbi:methyltransferase domain-containing protein [bacterium]|nr:methyltransferase domain-containing protein [bacterium]MCI0605076.1 methyltransferase domain-containing protein [bacterium]
MKNPSLPSRELLQLQSDWLAEARARILRLAEIARRKMILDLGAGYGFVTGELRRRTSGTVIALDRSSNAISGLPLSVCGEATELPFPALTFDLIFSQNVLLWIRQKEDAIKEAFRVLKREGAWVLLEPDYGAMIEHPSGVKSVQIWTSVLKRCGADPEVGRKLPLLLRGADFRVRTELLPRLENPRLERFDFLSQLDLTKEEQRELERIKKLSQMLSPADHVAHLPYFMIIAERT